MKGTFNGRRFNGSGDLGALMVKEFVRRNPESTFADVQHEFEGVGRGFNTRTKFLISQDDYQNETPYYKNKYRRNDPIVINGTTYFITTHSGDGTSRVYADYCNTHGMTVIFDDENTIVDLTQMTPEEREGKFAKWASTAISLKKHAPFDNATIGAYKSALNRLKTYFGDLMQQYNSVYDISNATEFDRLMENIFHAINYEHVKKDVIGFSLPGGLNLYSRFLHANGQSENLENVEIPEEGDESLILPWNLIYFGAPGTGKSFNLDADAQREFGEHIRRVTFHSEYNYADFVGSLRPVNDPVTHRPNYLFKAGPFIKSLCDALQNPENKYCLIIEEINRANPASVFGDIFQLLDRENGVSRYGIDIDDELKAYLEAKNLDIECIKLPANLYIWATMNSADQGVYPMDTAFKRRWEFKYIGIDDNADGSDFDLFLCGKSYSWNSLRQKINTKLIDLGVNEDKLIGPWFLKNSANQETFINKVVMYLFEDAARQYRKKLFNPELKLLSQIRDKIRISNSGISSIFAENDAAMFDEQVEEQHIDGENVAQDAD